MILEYKKLSTYYTASDSWWLILKSLVLELTVYLVSFKSFLSLDFFKSMCLIRAVLFLSQYKKADPFSSDLYRLFSVKLFCSYLIEVKFSASIIFTNLPYLEKLSVDIFSISRDFSAFIKTSNIRVEEEKALFSFLLLFIV